MARHDFLDAVTGDVLELVIDETLLGLHGVEHPGCDELAIVTLPDGDFACECGRVGHIDGEWVLQLWRAEATLSGGA